MIELFLQDLVENKEHFSDSDNEYSFWSMFWSVFRSVFWFGVSCIAVYLSLNCKSNQKQQMFSRIIYAILAFIFGLFYIVANLVFFNECR